MTTLDDAGCSAGGMDQGRSTLILCIAAALLALLVGPTSAGDNFLAFSTSDPFLPATTRMTDYHVFGGAFTTGTAGNALNIVGTDYTSNYSIGGVVGRDVFELGAGFVLGGVAGAAVRFGADDDTTGEAWGGLRLRHHGIVVGDLAISPGITAGLSVVTGPTEIERAREAYYGGDATLLGYLAPEIAFRVRQVPQWELIYQLHHRSGADGTFGDLGEGSNANTIGLRYRF